jgi:creatinine amidohydrolase/Fe(II)-dependent formamide hydrolase-like protein
MNKEVKPLQDMVSRAIRECVPTHQYRTLLILGMIGVALAAKDVERTTTLHERRQANATYERRKKVLRQAVGKLYEATRKDREQRPHQATYRKAANMP